MTLRRDFALPQKDQKFLEEYGLSWETVVDGSQWLLIHDFFTNSGYNHSTVTCAIRIETGYPTAPLDMAYFFPALARKDGRPIGATQATQQLDGKAFQRWSRHRTSQNPWTPGVDSVGAHIFLIEDWLEREFMQ